MLRQIKGFVGNIPVGLIATVLVAILIPSLLVTGLGLLAVNQADSFVREQSRELALDRLQRLQSMIDREWGRRLRHLAFILDDADRRLDRLGALRQDPWVREVLVVRQGRVEPAPPAVPYRLLPSAAHDPRVAAIRALEGSSVAPEERRRRALELVENANDPSVELEALLLAARASAPSAPMVAAGDLETAIERFGRTVDESRLPRDVSLLVWQIDLLSHVAEAGAERDAAIRALVDALAHAEPFVDDAFLLASQERARRAAPTEWDAVVGTFPLRLESSTIPRDELAQLIGALARAPRGDVGPEGLEVRRASLARGAHVVLLARSFASGLEVCLWLDTRQLRDEVDLLREELEIPPTSLVYHPRGDEEGRDRRRAIATMSVPRPLSQFDWLYVPEGPPPGFRSFEIFTLASFSWAVVVLALTIVVGTFIVLRSVLREMRTARMKSDFVSFITHELKTPLAAIRMFSETLTSGRYEDDEEMRMCLRMIDRESERLGNLIDRVLEYSRIQSNQRQLALTSSSMADVVEDAVRLFKEYHKNNPREIDVNTVQHISKIRMDRASMVELVLNLLSNANKYSPRDKKITVNLRETVDEIIVEVIDRGYGIRKRDQRRVFDRFFRAEDLLTRDIEGYGLGLAFARYIARQHKGDIRVSSQVNSGSTFTLYLRKEDVLAE